jgi:hypothetical protein
VKFPTFWDPYARDGHRFESPQLHQEVRTCRSDFLRVALPRPAAPQVGSPAQQAPAAADPVAAADRVAAAVNRAAAAAGVIDVGFSGGHDFAAQDSILTRPFA